MGTEGSDVVVEYTISEYDTFRNRSVLIVTSVILNAMSCVPIS